MEIICIIDRKIKGLPMWSKGKSYNVLNTEYSENKTLVYLADDEGRKHWMTIGSNFIIK